MNQNVLRLFLLSWYYRSRYSETDYLDGQHSDDIIIRKLSELEQPIIDKNLSYLINTGQLMQTTRVADYNDDIKITTVGINVINSLLDD